MFYIFKAYNAEVSQGCSKGTVTLSNFWTILGLIYKIEQKIIGFCLNFMVFGGKNTVIYQFST